MKLRKSIYLYLIYRLLLLGKTVCFKNIVEYKAGSTFYIILLQYEVEYWPMDVKCKWNIKISHHDFI